MKVEFEPGRLKQTKWYEYAIRFVFGGVIAALAGWVGQKFGPATAGLFLGFPAILPAALTLIEDHQSKESHRIDEAKDQAGEDSIGAALGCFGMISFAITVWLLDLQSPIAVVCVAFASWAVVALAAWLAFQALSGRSKSKTRRSSDSSRSTQQNRTIA